MAKAPISLPVEKSIKAPLTTENSLEIDDTYMVRARVSLTSYLENYTFPQKSAPNQKSLFLDKLRNLSVTGRFSTKNHRISSGFQVITFLGDGVPFFDLFR